MNFIKKRLHSLYKLYNFKKIEIFYNTEFVRMTFENGIIEVIFKKGPITIDIAKEIIDERLKFSKNKKIPTLATDNGNGISSLDREAREFMGNGKALEGISASAFYTNSPLNKYLINFFLRISVKKTQFPVKIFSNREDAIKWLENFVENK